MHKSIEDFLQREEKRRNRSLSKTFLRWLQTERAQDFSERLEKILSKKGSEFDAVQLLKKAEEAAKTDQVFKRSDTSRKKALKKFQQEFDKWVKSGDGQAYTDEIETLLHRSDLNEKDRANKIQSISDEAEAVFIETHPHLVAQKGPYPKSRIRARRKAWAQNIDSVVFNVIEPGLKQLGFVGSALMQNWSQVVGPAIAKNSRAEKIAYPPKTRSHGKLLISVRSGFNTEIQHRRDEIIRRVNSYFGFKAISDIQISKKPFDSFVTPGQKNTQRLRSTQIKPAPKPNDHAASLINGIKDPKLREVLYELGCVLNARNR